MAQDYRPDDWQDDVYLTVLTKPKYGYSIEGSQVLMLIEGRNGNIELRFRLNDIDSIIARLSAARDELRAAL